MAARKEYEMLFSLNAQLGGSFGGTFSKAQQQMLQMQKEVQNLNKTQSDISAYQRQQQAVEGTKSKLALLQQQYDNIQKEIQETGTYSSDLENKLLAKQHQIDKTTDALGRQTQKLDEMGNGLREAGVDTGNLEKESERLASELGELKKKQEDAAEGAQDFGSKGAEAFTAVGDALIAAGIAKALKELYGEFKQCVSIAADFEASISNVEAISGASAEEIAQLSDMAKQLGATTKFTAKESADAMGYMAMAGWSAEQMLDGMSGVLTLAAASGEDLAQVSDIVTDSMTAFGLSASETARYADVLAATAANANTSVGVMGETFKYAAPVAGALGYSIEDVSVAIGLMANAGIKGSNAGTALRNVFNGLLEGVTLTGKAFGEAEVTAVKADGTMEDFGTTLDELRGYFEQMTEAERVSNAMAIAGQRGYAGLLAVLNASEGDFNKLTAAINESSGAAQRMADVKMDNLNGQLTLLNSAADAVRTTVGNAYNKELTSLAKVGTEILTGINDFLSKHPVLLKSLIAITAEVGVFVGAYYGYIAAKKIMNTLRTLSAALTLKDAAAAGADAVATGAQATATGAATTAQLGLNAAMAANPIGLILTGVAALTVALIALSSAESSEAAEVRKLSESSRKEYEQIQNLKTEYKEVSATYGENSEQAQYLAWRIDDLTESFEENKQTLEEYISECNELNQTIGEDVKAIRDSFDEIDSGESTTLALVHRLSELASQTVKTTETQEEMKAIIKELNEIVPGLSLNYEKVANSTTDFGAAIEATVKAQALMKMYDTAQEGMVKAYNDQVKAQMQLKDIETQRALAKERLNKASAAYYALLENSDDDTAGGFWTEEYKEYSAALSAYEEYNNAYMETQQAAKQAQNAYQQCKDELVSYVEATEGGTDSETTFNTVIDSTNEKLKELSQKYNEAYEAAYESISGQYGLWDEAEKVVATSVGSINSNLESQTAYWNAYNDNLVSLQGRTGEIEGLSEVIASFADGSKDSVSAIAGMAAASDEELKTMVKNYQENKKAMDTASQNLASLKTDFETQYQEIVNSAADQIEAMDMSEEAAANAKATLQAYVDAAKDEMPAVVEAFQTLRSESLSALNGTRTFKPNSYGKSGNTTTSGGVPTYTGIINLPTLPGFASGTDNAPFGMALVGEEGPELVLLKGGEQILTAEETKRLREELAMLQKTTDRAGVLQLPSYGGGTKYAQPGLARVGEYGTECLIYDAPTAPTEAQPISAGGYNITFSPIYNINGDMNAEELEVVLRQHDENLKEQLQELLEELESDKARSRYA